MRGLGVGFSTSSQICEKCDFKRWHNVFAIFFNVESINFQFQRMYFSVVFFKGGFKTDGY
jgi:hypothetical protein